MYNIVIGWYCHETNTFNPLPTTIERFGGREQVILPPDGSNLHSFNRAFAEVLCERADVNIIPTVAASAEPWGRVQRSAHEYVKEHILKRIKECGKVDGVLLALHGAMVLEDADDGEGDLLEAIRREVGPDVPINVSLDLHANITQKMLDNATVLINCDTYPHIDMMDRSREAARIMLDTLDGKVKPVMAYKKLPLLPEFIYTDHPDLRKFGDMMFEFEKDPAVLTASIAYGFFLADIYEGGLCVVVVTDNDKAKAQRLADKLGETIWNDRKKLRRQTIGLDEALDDILAHPDVFPCIIADGSDNPGGGASGDGTHILRRILERKIGGVVIACMLAPEIVAQAEKAGVGAMIDVSLGGKFFPAVDGEPIVCRAYVASISDGTYDRRLYPRMPRSSPLHGKAACLIVDDVEVLVSSRPAQTWLTDVIYACGINPEMRRIIVVKSAVHFRHAFGPIAKKIYDVFCPGMAEQKISPARTFERCRRPIYPLDDM